MPVRYPPAAASSAALPSWLALLHERGHAFLLVVAREEQEEVAPLKFQPRLERQLERPIDGLLRRPDGERWHGGDLARQVECRTQSLLARDHPRHEPVRLCLTRRQVAAGQDELHRLGLAQRAREALCATRA